MLIEVLRILKDAAADRALAAGFLGTPLCALGRGRGRSLLPTVGWILLHPVYSHQMPLENIGAVEALFGRRARVWTESTHHRSFVMSQSMPILIVLASEALLIIFAGWDRALLGSLILVRKHMCLEIFE